MWNDNRYEGATVLLSLATDGILYGNAYVCKYVLPSYMSVCINRVGQQS